MIALVFASTSCAPIKDEAAKTTTSSGSYLYVASGVCYSGSNTTYSNTGASNRIYRVDPTTGQRDALIADYYAFPSSGGDSPVALASLDSNTLGVLVENTTTVSLRRVEKVAKKPSGTRSTFSNNITALSAQLRSFTQLPSKDFLISKSTAIEFITSLNTRIGAPFISASVAPCATSTTLIPKVLTLSNGKIVFLHAAASQNRIGVYATSGGTTCATATAAPNAASFPTAAFYDAANTKLFVAYAGNAATADLNSIYVYTVNESTGVLSSPQKIYDASGYPATYPYLLYGISAMTYDAASKSVFISTATTTAAAIVTPYAIEKFTYDSAQIGVDNAKVLTRVGTSPFIPYDADTKCISDMIIAD